MRSEDSATAVIVSVIAICITLIIHTLIVQSQITERTKFDRGYSQMPVYNLQNGIPTYYQDKLWVRLPDTVKVYPHRGHEDFFSK